MSTIGWPSELTCSSLFPFSSSSPSSSLIIAISARMRSSMLPASCWKKAARLEHERALHVVGGDRLPVLPGTVVARRRHGVSTVKRRRQAKTESRVSLSIHGGVADAWKGTSSVSGTESPSMYQHWPGGNETSTPMVCMETDYRILSMSKVWDPCTCRGY